MIKFLLKLLPDEAINNEFLRRYEEDVLADDFTTEQESLVFKDLSKIDNIEGFLNSIMKKDRVRYFNIHPDGQSIVKGAFLRTQWLLKGLKKINKEANEKPLENPRYG